MSTQDPKIIEDGNNQTHLNFLYTALKSAEDNIRGYDTKAQIVGIGYIFSMGIISSIGDLIPDAPDFNPITIVFAWLIAILPIVLFGAVLYPSRRSAPTIGSDGKSISHLFFAKDSTSNTVHDYLPDLRKANHRK